MSITAENLKEIMRNWTTGVAIITSQFEDNVHGMTVNSFTSVSLDPPLVVVTLANNTRSCLLVKNSKEFGVTILSSSQKEISDKFSGKFGEFIDRFENLDVFSLSNNIPLISAGLAWINCDVIQEIDLGHSTLFIARVIAAKSAGGDPLLYHDRGYYQLGDRRD